MFNRLHTRDILLVALLVLIPSAMLGSTWFGARQVENQMIRDQAAREVFKWARFAEFHLADFQEILGRGRASEQDKALIAAMAEANNVLRYRFFNRAGYIVLSSIPGEVASRDVNQYLSDVMQQGGTFIKLEEEGQFAELEPDFHGGAVVQSSTSPVGEFERSPGSIYAEAYSAVMDDGRFQGAIEVQMDVTPIAMIVRHVVGIARAVMLGIVLLMAAVTTLAVYWNIRHRNHELHDLRIARESAA